MKKKEKKSGKLREILLALWVAVMIFLGYWGVKVYLSERAFRLDRAIDGDTLVFVGGKTVSLLGVNTDEKGDGVGSLAKQYLEVMLRDKNVWLEYENGASSRMWVWVGCESKPRFWVWREDGSNPVGCSRGVLVNEQVVKMGWSEVEFEPHAGKLRYEDRLLEAVREVK